MSLDSIAQIAQAESAAEQKRAETLNLAKRIISEAEALGKEQVESARTESDKLVRELMQSSEEQAAEYTRSVTAQAERDCTLLRATAEGRLDRAADLIVERIVGA